MYVYVFKTLTLKKRINYVFMKIYNKLKKIKKK